MRPDFLLVVCLVAVGCKPRQHAQGVGGIVVLKQTRESVLRQLGEPELVYAPREYTFLSSDQRTAAWNVDELTQDIYTRRYGGTEFRIGVGYSLDDSVSRLHPTERVRVLVFTPDKHLSYRSLIAMIPQTAMICSRGCKVLETYHENYNWAYVYPADQSGRDHQTLPCWQVMFPSDSGRHPNPSFEKMQVEQMMIGGECDPIYEKKQAEGKYNESKFVEADAK